VGVNPVEFYLQLFRGIAQGPEAAGATDCGDYVAAVAEGEEPEVDADHFTDFQVNSFLLCLWALTALNPASRYVRRRRICKISSPSAPLCLAGRSLPHAAQGACV
jgi:hypothetical protein